MDHDLGKLHEFGKLGSQDGLEQRGRQGNYFLSLLFGASGLILDAFPPEADEILDFVAPLLFRSAVYWVGHIHFDASGGARRGGSFLRYRPDWAAGEESKARQG